MSNQQISENVKIGENSYVASYVNLYGCHIGNNTKVGAFVEIQKNAKIGNNCKISSHTFICEGVIIEDRVFVGHSVTFINDRFPRSTNHDGIMKTENEWSLEPTLVKEGASIGSGSVIMCGITIGSNAIVGAGSVVTRNVEPGTIVAGNPARYIRGV